MFKGFLKMAVMAGCLFLGVEHIGNTCVWAEVDILREALNNNQIRVAGPEIIKKWERKRIELYEKAGMKIDLSEFYYTIPAYEILSPDFAFPAELPMLAAVDYYLPESFELPEGDIRHLRIFLLEDGTCTGHGSECVDLTGDSLRVAINKKHIRIAYPETIKQWEQKRIELYEKAGLKINPADFKYIRNDSAYEILSPDFVFPDGLSGADSVDFYLPESFQIPEGDTWSIGIFMLEDGACLGHGFGCVQLREDSLREAINREHIRIVRPETIKKWAEKALALYTEAGLEVDEVYFRKPAHSNAFEIISSGFVIPDGLAGADSVSFYLPENLKIPPGPFGHSNMYLLKDGSCLGHGTYCTDIRDNELLRTAINNNYIRAARPVVIKDWYKKFINVNNLKSDQRLLDLLLNGSAFEMLSDIFIMSGELSGANSIELFVPENLNPPAGDFGHSNVFLLKDGSCIGSFNKHCVRRR